MKFCLPGTTSMSIYSVLLYGASAWWEIITINNPKNKLNLYLACNMYVEWSYYIFKNVVF